MASSLGIGRPWKRALTALRIGLRAPAMGMVVGVLALAGMVGPGGLCARIAQAQDDWDMAKKPADRQNGNVRFGLPDFDQWVFGGRGDMGENMLKTQLAVRLEAANHACELSPAQREKLRLAGEGDLKRLSRSIGQAREAYREIGQDQQKLNAFSQLISKLQTSIQSGVFGESSLYQKVLQETLTKDQAARYELQERERRKFRYEAKIELVLTNFENSLVLRADQRQRLVKLIVDETEPPKKAGPYDFYAVLFQAAKLDDEKVKPILDEGQRESFKKVFNQYRGLEQFLRGQGYIP
jgi:hypothetical protein